MKKVIVSASAIALLAGVLALSGDAWSQSGEKPADKPAANIPHKVGLIDMAFVFKNYKKFEQLREDLKAEIASNEEKAKAMQADVVALQKTLKDFTEGSEQYTKTEKIMVQKMADFEGFRRQMQREFLKKESGIYLQVYNEVSDMVERYATHFKYTLIIRFNRDELDSDNPQALMQGMNRQVVYYRADDDITKPVLDSLNKKLGGSKETTPVKGGDRSAVRDKENTNIR